MPVLNRPHRVKPLLDSIEESTPSDAQTVFLCDIEDLGEQQAIADAARGTSLRVAVAGPGGSYAHKVNWGVGCPSFSAAHYFLAADDLRFHEGWYEEARAHLENGIGVVGVNDLLPRQRDHATHFLITREYAERGTVDEPDKLLHEGYSHWFVDDEFIATAKRRNAYAYAPHAIVEHLHPMGGKAPDDETYRRGRAQVRQDRRHFHRRKQLWTSP